MAAASVVPRTAWWKGHLRSGRREAMVVAGWQESGVLSGRGGVGGGGGGGKGQSWRLGRAINRASYFYSRG